MDYTLVDSSTPCAPCWNSFSWLFHIAGQQTTGTSNYRNSYSLFALKSFAPVTWGLLFYTTNYSQFSSLLTHWIILNHIQWFQLVSVFMYYYFAFESVSQAFCTKKSKTAACEHDQDAHLPYLSAFSSFPPGKQVDLNAWKTLHVNSVTRKMSCPAPPFIFFKPHPINSDTLPFFWSAQNKSSH